MQCSRCKKEAILFQPYSGRHLCRDHLAADIEARIKREIRRHRWMRPGDHLAVAFSGNGSSRALLSIFSRLTAERRDIRLSAIIIDEGIEGYRHAAEAGAFAGSLGVQIYTGSFAEAFGRTAGGIAREEGSGSPCTRCRELRRPLIEAIARREGVTRILGARTLEDLAADTLGHVLDGSADALIDGSHHGQEIPWADPLGPIPRKEAEIYAGIVTPGTGTGPCPYSTAAGFTTDVKDLLQNYTQRHPAAPFAVIGIREALGTGCTADGRHEGGSSRAA